MKKIVSIFLLIIMLCSLTACGDNGLFVVKNISYEPGEERLSMIVDGKEYYTATDGTYTYELVGKGSTDTVYTVQVRIGVYNKSNEYCESIYDIVTIRENETKTITGTMSGFKDRKFKVLKITWN